jgi:hypothetical protein
LNWEFYLTTVSTVFTLAVISLIVFPVYAGIYMRLTEKKRIESIEFIKSMQEIQKESKIDDAIERIFEKGVNE